jgi:hypothetical protein
MKECRGTSDECDGDYVEAQAFQNSGNPLLIRYIPATSPEFGMAKLP